MRRNLNLQKASAFIIALNILQIAGVFIIAGYSSIRNHMVGEWKIANLDLLLLLVVLLVVLNSIITIRDRYILSRVDRQYGMLEETIEQIEKLNYTLRAQRHDFLNHLQVVYSLMELGDDEEARNYIDRIFADIQKVSRILKTSHPAVNALLQAKMLYCEKLGIQVDLQIASTLQDVPMPAWELCRVLGNLLDNAIYAVKDNAQVKKISIQIDENVGSYQFRISDNGAVIQPMLLDRIFKPGFTTKGEAGDGMGLAIVKELVDQYGGQTSVTSNMEETVFTITLAKQLQSFR